MLNPRADTQGRHMDKKLLRDLKVLARFIAIY